MKRALAGMTVALLPVSCFSPCAGRPVPLLAGLQSHQTPDQARAALGHFDRWTLVSEEPGPRDSRPRFDFLTVEVAPVEHLGHRGPAELRFYNDRLMSVSFTPADPASYLQAVRSLPSTPLPDGSGLILQDGRRVALPPGGRQKSFTFEWYDECLHQEMNSWIMAYS